MGWDECHLPWTTLTAQSPIAEEEQSTSLLSLVSLQNADGSWPLDSDLASLLDLSEAEIAGETPAQVSVEQGI